MLASLERIRPMEVVHTTLDLAGSVDPTPIFDTLNASLYAGEGRWGEAATSLLGTVSYFGGIAKGGRFAARTASFVDSNVEAGRHATKGIHYARDLGIQAFNPMYKYTAGTGLQRHHLIEQRFAKNIDFGELSQLCVAMSRPQHTIVTREWRKAISYGAGTRAAKRKDVFNAARRIYGDNPEVLKALGLE